MPSKDTLEIQKCLVDLGTALGFEAIAEDVPTGSSDSASYTPHFDVVWYFSGKTCPAPRWWTPVQKMLPPEAELPLGWPRYAAAVFEIENRDPSSKCDLGDLVNMNSIPACFRFLVTNSTKYHDMYRRAVKLNRACSIMFGDRNCIVIDKLQITQTLGVREPTAVRIPTPVLKAREMGGGTERSGKLRDQLSVHFLKAGLGVYQDGFPPKIPSVSSIANHYHMLQSTRRVADTIGTMLQTGAVYTIGPEGQRNPIKKPSDFVYECKPDIIVGHAISGGMVEWVREIATSLGEDRALYPCLSQHMLEHAEWFIPVCGVEIEREGNKHALGGLANLSRRCLYGVVISDDPRIRRIVEAVKPRIGALNVLVATTSESDLVPMKMGG